MESPTLRLDRIHRQAVGNPIIALSQHIRDHGDLPEHWTNTPNVQFLRFDEMQSILENLYATEKQSMNYQGRCMKHRKDMPITPVDGDQLVCLRNIKGTLFNGMRGVLEGNVRELGAWYTGKLYFPDDDLEVEGDFLKAQLGREKTFSSFDELRNQANLEIYSWAKLGMLFDYGNAMTVHKSQGSQFKHVFLVYERPGFATSDDFRRWLYTAVTRARQHVYVVVGLPIPKGEQENMSNGDTKPVIEQPPFLKARDVRSTFEHLKAHSIGAGSLLEHILRSLAVGRADDPKAIATIALEIVTTRMHYQTPSSRGATTSRVSSAQPNLSAGSPRSE